MVTHSSVFARRIPWTKEPGGLQSMGLQRVEHDKVTNTFKHIHASQFFFQVLFGALGYVNYQILPRMMGKQVYTSQLRN